MRLNMDRICQLAGIQSTSRRSYSGGLIKEGADHGKDQEEENESYVFEESDDIDEDEDEDENEMMDVDEVMLVQELRRARRLMNESKKRKAKKQQKLQEMQLKGIIDQEVKNVLKELQLTSGWVYGKNKPRRSRNGYTHQGSFLKGMGFK